MLFIVLYSLRQEGAHTTAESVEPQETGKPQSQSRSSKADLMIDGKARCHYFARARPFPRSNCKHDGCRQPTLVFQRSC
jgi:hypothetical protein